MDLSGIDIITGIYSTVNGKPSFECDNGCFKKIIRIEDMLQGNSKMLDDDKICDLGEQNCKRNFIVIDTSTPEVTEDNNKTMMATASGATVAGIVLICVAVFCVWRYKQINIDTSFAFFVTFNLTYLGTRRIEGDNQELHKRK